MVAPRVELAAAMAVPGHERERQAQPAEPRARDDDLLVRRHHVEGT